MMAILTDADTVMDGERMGRGRESGWKRDEVE
jgi:hypothetical protein